MNAAPLFIPNRDDVLALNQRIEEAFSARVITGFELEFYTDISRIDALRAELEPTLSSHQIALVEWQAEDGQGQWECATAHETLDVSLPKFTALREALAYSARKMNVPLSFSSKPYHDQPASGFHVHLHLEDASGASLFKKNGDDISAPFAHSISGLLRVMPASMPYFMPSDESYARLREGEHVPANVCWGVNNRSAALRIPENMELKSEIKHIEHRVCGADAEPIAAVWAMLVGVHAGLSQNLTLPEPIYGMARDAQYDVPELARSAAEAQRAFEADRVMQDYVSMFSSESSE